MQMLLRQPNAPLIFTATAIAGLGIFVFAISVLMLGPSSVVGDRLPELTCLQVAFTAERYSDVFLSFSPEARAAILRLLVPGDIVFAWGYGFMLAGLTGLLAMRLPRQWQRAGALIMWAPLAASALDCVEDVFLYAIAGQYVDNPAAIVAGALPLLAGIAAVTKYFLLAVVTPVYGIGGIVKGLSYDRNPGSLVLYVILGLLLFSMVLRPLQQIPPCL